LVTAPLKKKLRVGLLMDGGAGKPPSDEVRAATMSSAKLMESLGHRVIPTTWPMGPEFINDFLLLWASGARASADSIGKVHGPSRDASVLGTVQPGPRGDVRQAPKDALPQAMQRLHVAALAYDPWFAGTSSTLSCRRCWPPPRRRWASSARTSPSTP
jgi:amidase